LTDVAFISPARAVVVGYGGTILQSDDGGTNWVAMNSLVTTDLFSVFFADETHDGRRVTAGGSDHGRWGQDLVTSECAHRSAPGHSLFRG